MLNQRLAQKLQQKLSPQQIQLMKLLQIPLVSLEQRIKEEMEANPALEIDAQVNTEEEAFQLEDNTDGAEERKDEEVDLTEYLTDDDVADYKTRDTNYPDPDEERTIPVSVSETFHESLARQLGMVALDDRQYQIAEQIIGSIGEDGYLRRELEAIVDDLAFSQNIMTDNAEVEELLAMIQDFEPAGVGARTLQECLLIQLRKKDSNPTIRLAISVLDTQFEAFAKKHYEKIMRALAIEEDELKWALDEILRLNPKPGAGHADAARTEQTVLPDFVIENKDGELALRLTKGSTPDLRISSHFKEMMQGYQESKVKDRDQKQAVLFIKQKIDAAKWFIDAIKQRQLTLYNTMHAIMDYQQAFFLSGDETKLRPMILKDIATTIGMDISTISRVANSKFVQTEFGTFPLKYFFSESLTNEAGEEVSTREVKKILQNLIEKEDKRKPLSDQKLMEHLKEKGYNIARRTVAKYREQLNVPVARLRKEL